MMKTALIEPVGGHGGMDHYDYGLAGGLAANNVAVEFHTCQDTEQRTIENVNVLRTFGKVWKASNKASKLFQYLRGHYKAFSQAQKMGCNVVHLHFFSFDWLNFLVVFILNRFAFKKVLTIHDVSDFRGGSNALFRDYILKSFDSIIVHNQFSFNELKSFHDKENVTVIPHGHYLHSVNELSYLPQEKGKLNLLFFGQIKKVKGLDILLKAMAKVISTNPNVSLQIAGKVWHDDLLQYQQLIEELGLTEFVKTNFSFIPNEEVDGYFQRADIVVLPYRRIYQSGVLLLAMSYGRAVLASNLPPFAEVVEDGKTGYLFQSEDSDSLAEVILQLVSEQHQVQVVAHNASAKLKAEYDWDDIGRKTIRVYNS